MQKLALETLHQALKRPECALETHYMRHQSREQSYVNKVLFEHSQFVTLMMRSGVRTAKKLSTDSIKRVKKQGRILQTDT